jgi:hypothetical protein
MIRHRKLQRNPKLDVRRMVDKPDPTSSGRLISPTSSGRLISPASSGRLISPASSGRLIRALVGGFATVYFG